MDLIKSFILGIIVIWLLTYAAGLHGLDDTDDTDDLMTKKRSGLRLYTDHKTGLQYVGGGFFGGITPRLDEDGNHMRLEK